MAETTTNVVLALAFATLEGTTRTYRIQNVNPEVNVNFVKALTQGFVTNAAIFNPQPAVPKSAALVTTTTAPFDLD